MFNFHESHYFVGAKENEDEAAPARPRPLGPGREANLPPGARRRRPGKIL